MIEHVPQHIPINVFRNIQLPILKVSFDNPFRATARQHSNGRCVPPLHEHYASSPRHRISQPAIFIHWQIISGRQIPKSEARATSPNASPRLRVANGMEWYILAIWKSFQETPPSNRSRFDPRHAGITSAVAVQRKNDSCC